MTVPASRFAVPWHGLHALVGLAACLVGVVNRRSLVDDARRRGADPNVWDQVVATASDANLLVYFALPAALALGLLASERVGGDLILIRTGSRTRRLRHLLASCLRATLPFPLALLVAAALSAVCLPLGNGWSSYALHPDGTLTPSMAAAAARGGRARRPQRLGRPDRADVRHRADEAPGVHDRPGAGVHGGAADAPAR